MDVAVVAAIDGQYYWIGAQCAFSHLDVLPTDCDICAIRNKYNHDVSL